MLGTCSPCIFLSVGLMVYMISTSLSGVYSSGESPLQEEESFKSNTSTKPTEPQSLQLPDGGNSRAKRLSLEKRRGSDCHTPSSGQCSDYLPECLDHAFNYSCVYGRRYNVSVSVPDVTDKCQGDRNFSRTFSCRFCYQSDEYSCLPTRDCDVRHPHDRWGRTNCTVRPGVTCMGSRTFYRMVECNWASGYKQSTALLLSVTLGGFGVDRFYLGYWRQGLGKLFSFGGLGVWTIVDAILIAIGYIGPADNSLYI